MKKIICLCALLQFVVSQAQVGINTTSPQSTIDIVASNKATPSNKDGILIPRIDAFPTTNPTASQDAMMVYLTTTSAGKAPGFYFWDNTASAWSLLEGADDQKIIIDDATGVLTISGGNSLNLATLADDDSDTKIQVEKTADDDKIRFDVAGKEYINIESKGRLNFLNTGNSIFIGEGSGVNDDLTDNRNLFIGKDAGKATVVGQFNIAIGYESGMTVVGNTRSVYNTSVGYQAFQNGVRGYNASFGYQAGQNLTGGSNVAIGYQAANKTKNNNVAVGYLALSKNEGGDQNVAVGPQNSSYKFGTENVAIGSGAMNQSNGSGQSVDQNTAIGDAVLGNFQSGSGVVGIGHGALHNQKLGSETVAIGRDAGIRAENSSKSVIIGSLVGGVRTTTNGTSFEDSVIIGANSATFDTRSLISDRLIIENSDSKDVLIGGDFANNRVGINVDMTTTSANKGVAPTNLTHTLTVGGSAKIDDVLNLKPRATVPSNPSEGDIYYFSSGATKKLRVYTGSVWEDLN